MKNIAEIQPNFNAPAKQTGLPIDDFAKNIIDKVFDQLSVIFPAWKHALPTDKDLSMAKLEWTKAFTENGINSLEQIKYGFIKARRSESDFLPSCGKFISWCTPSAEDLGYPSESQALKECIAHRNNQKMFTPLNIAVRPFIVELCKSVDWWLINTASNQVEHKKADKNFHDAYMGLINSGYIEPEETASERLETKEVIRERMSESQLADEKIRREDHMKNIKANLAKAKAKDLLNR